MIIVIQCAASKKKDAGHLHTEDGKPVFFVADPEKAPESTNCIYARPDDLSDRGVTWRELLLQYNDSAGQNPLKLYQACDIYENSIYRRLTERFGMDKMYILSAGWGLIEGGFLIPAYDITFSASAESYKRRRKKDTYNDLSRLPNDTNEPIIFFGGKDYLPLFCNLTSSNRNKKIVFYNSENRPDVPGYLLNRFHTRTRTNWHYECANLFLDGKIDVNY